MSLPNPPLLRIEDLKGLPFELCHTSEQAQSALDRYGNGFCIVQNVAPSPAPTPVEPPPPDSLEIYLGELVAVHGTRDDVFKHLLASAKRLNLIDQKKDAEDKKRHEAAEERRAAKDAKPMPPPACPFKVGELVVCRFTKLVVAVEAINDATGIMHVGAGSLKGRVPAANYPDYEAAPEGAVLSTPAEPEAIAPAEIEVPAAPAREKIVPKRPAVKSRKK